MATMFILSPFLIVSEVDASALSELKKIAKKMEKRVNCGEENLEKTLFYGKKGKTYQANPTCDPDEQYKYDRLNQLQGIYEYKDRHHFVLGDYDDEDDNDKDDDNNKKKKHKDRDDNDDDDDRKDNDNDKDDLGDHQKDGLE